MLSLIWVTWFCLSFSRLYLWTSSPTSSISAFLVTLLVCLILWSFPGLHSTVPPPQPTAAFPDATGYTASIPLLVPAPCRCLWSSSAHLWWRLNSSLSSRVCLLTVSQVCQFESVFKPSLFCETPLQRFHYPAPNVLQIISQSSSGFCLSAWTLHTDMCGFRWVAGFVKISSQLQRPQRTMT